MKTFPTVEDYLEVLAGKRDLVTGTMKLSGWMGYEFKPIVSLARYDVNFLNSVTDHTLGGNALTDKQAELAVKMVLKYTRQLNVKSISTEPLVYPKYRHTLRVIDRSKAIWMDQEYLYLRFPYNTEMIQQLRDLLNTRQGSAKFDKDTKTWKIAISEYNVNFLYTWATGHEFSISQDVQSVMAEILEIESNPYKIELVCDSEGIRITNAPVSMIEYLRNQGITFVPEDLVRLVDLSSVLGYTVDLDVLKAVELLIGSDLVVFAQRREYELNGNAQQIERLVRYATITNRLPVIIFDTTPANSLSTYQEILGKDQVTVLGNKKLESLDEITTPVVFSQRAVNFDRMPLIVSHVGLIAGGEKSMMIQNSEKIVYFNCKL
jgi:hypothetical protein